MNWIVEKAHQAKDVIIALAVIAIIVGILFYFLGSPGSLGDMITKALGAFGWVISHGIALGKTIGHGIAQGVDAFGSLF